MADSDSDSDADADDRFEDEDEDEHETRALHSFRRARWRDIIIPMHRLSLAPTCLALVLGLAHDVCSQDAPAALDGPAELLREGERLLKRRRQEEAVEVLRRLVGEFPDAPEAVRGREILARGGVGEGFRVVFDERAALHKLDVTEAMVVGATQDRLDGLRAFFRQTYGDLAHGAAPRFRVVVYAGRARFRAAHPDTHRRSASSAPPPTVEADRRGKKKGGAPGAANADLGNADPENAIVIESYFDARIADRGDALELLVRSVAREMAAALARRHLRRPLSDALETGVVEYLAARLFPRPYEGLGQSAEEVLRGFAREGLGRITRRDDFERHLMSASPDNKVAPAVFWQWTGLSYSIVDALVGGEIDRRTRREEDGVARVAQSIRVRKFQALLREYEALSRKAEDRKALLAIFERLLDRHFGLRLEELHRDLIARARRYQPLEPDFQGFTD